MTDGIKPQILIVDDEPSVRECLGLLLRSAGYDGLWRRTAPVPCRN